VRGKRAPDATIHRDGEKAVSGRSIKAGLLYVLLMMLGGSMSGCTGTSGISWKEEVQLSDGRIIAVTGSNVLYDGINAHGELDLYDPATGQGELTERYLRDRAAMLSWKQHFAYDDIQPESGTFYKFQGGTPYYFRDMTTDTRVSIGGGYRLDMLQPLTEFSHVVFGTENDDPIFGQGKNDWLYGGAGADTFASREAWKEAA
jgi:hypothetical protein